MSNGITHLLCAVDGGGSGCRTLVARTDGTVLARGDAGPANYTTDPAKAAANVCAAVSAATAKMDTSADLASLVTHVGLAGVLTQQDEMDLATRLPFETCTVSDDRMTSALGVLGARDGAVLAIGTGSFVAARHGPDVRFWGGWGFQVGDQSSGAWLGRAVLEQTLLACDGFTPQSGLTKDILLRFDDAPTRIATFAAKASPSDFATLAPLVVSAAKDGDVTGRMLMTRGADYLDRILSAAQISTPDIICLTGGVGPYYEPYLTPAFRALLQPEAGVALDGALHLARQNLEELETSA